ncbi:hypothetical protein KDW_41500 [Dictyobacter vulcani]|uniref:Uncharacterized protein n=1 Tax=Dictyobacter vulcani TaxID=2607529 RepID=A0A5J4KJS8_9CHLR|nr:hypothetical protein KDW_41500 [Dictyobacter vulcani]
MHPAIYEVIKNAYHDPGQRNSQYTQDDYFLRTFTVMPGHFFREEENKHPRLLMDILRIPPEKLKAAGRHMPKMKATPILPTNGDDALSHAILSPAQATIRLSWIV